MFTIDIEDRSISCQPERIVGGLNFDSQEGLLSLAAARGWGKEEMTAIWNSFAGTPEFSDCKDQKCFRNRNYAVERIWAAIQRLAAPAGNGHKPIVVSASDSTAPPIPAVLAVAMATEPAETATVGAQGAQVATEGQGAGEGASQPESAPLSAEPVGDGKQIEDLIVIPKRKRNKKTKEPKAKTPKAPKPAKVAKVKTEARKDSKKAEVIRLLQRKDGASIAEIMAATNWLAHSSRGFIHGALNTKAQLGVVSYKTDAGERRYRIPQ